MERRTRLYLAGGLVAATVIPYLGYAFAGDMPFVEDARGMGFVGLVLGAAAWLVLGIHAFGTRWLALAGAALAATLGIVAIVLETGTASSIFLGAFVAVIVAMFVIAVYEYLHDTGRLAQGGMTPGHI